jgi:uncharacterized protein YciI
MKKLVLAIVLLYSAAMLAQQAAPAPDLEIPDNMKQYFVAFLTKNEKSEKAHQDHDLIKQHLAFIRSQVEAGKFVLVGPFVDQGHIAGMMIINTATAEEATKILQVDPLVSGGWVETEIHPAMLPDASAVHITYPKKKT